MAAKQVPLRNTAARAALAACQIAGPRQTGDLSWRADIEGPWGVESFGVLPVPGLVAGVSASVVSFGVVPGEISIPRVNAAVGRCLPIWSGFWTVLAGIGVGLGS